MLLHVAYATGHQKVSLRTVDTRFVILAVAQFSKIIIYNYQNCGLSLALENATILFQLI